MISALKRRAFGTVLIIAVPALVRCSGRVDKDAIVKDRQATMKQQGKDDGRCQGLSRRQEPIRRQPKPRRPTLTQTTRKIPDLFPPGTGKPSPDGDYRAKGGDLDRLGQIPRRAESRGGQGRCAAGGGQGRRQGGDPDRLCRSRQERLRRLPHQVPRKAQELRAAALAILLGLAGSRAALAAEPERGGARRLSCRRCRLRPMPHRQQARRAGPMPAGGRSRRGLARW